MITVIPKESFGEVFPNWKAGDKVSRLTASCVAGSISYISQDDHYPYVTFNNSSVKDEYALMLLLSKQHAGVSFGYFWDAGFQIGCVAYVNEYFLEFTVSEDDLYEYTKAFLIDASEYDEETEEDDITERRVDCRDALQLNFLEYVAKQSPENYQLYELVPSELSVVPGFTLGNGFELEFEITILENLADDLEIYLKPLDYEDLDSVKSLYKQGHSEYWKIHRDRVRGYLKELPNEYHDDMEFFKAIIPLVAAWVLEYAGDNVRSDKSIIEMAVQSDIDNGYGASALEYANIDLLLDFDFIKAILKKQHNELMNLKNRAKANPELIDAEYIEELVSAINQETGKNGIKNDS